MQFITRVLNQCCQTCRPQMACPGLLDLCNLCKNEAKDEITACLHSRNALNLHKAFKQMVLNPQ